MMLFTPLESDAVMMFLASISLVSHDEGVGIVFRNTPVQLLAASWRAGREE
jgi:hypothetical protein